MKKLILAIFAILVLAGAYFGYVFFRGAVTNPQDRFFYVRSTDDVASVKQQLINEKFIKGGNFDLVAKLLRFKKAKPGKYKIPNGTSLYKLVRMLRSGDQVEVRVVINKERTKEMFAGKFGRGKKFDVEFDSLQMIRFLSSNDSLRPYGVDTNTVLSIVMPYTYSTKWNTTPGKLVQQFYTAYQKFWTSERKEKADSLHLTPLEVISLASIVEEETNKKADKYNIASTYLNRVRTGMKLQADPTVKFAMRNFALKRVLGVHLQTESPYNTYKYAGIPPGPICTPTPETIDAVLDAPHTDYLFFVASDKFDGSSVFTTNLTDHLKYARLYQQELTRRMDSSKKANANNPK